MKILICFFFYLMAYCNGSNERKAKVLPVFQVVRFPNDPCVISGGSKNGTCYTAEECSSKSGVNSGSCASGFGVCCTFSIGCGSTSSENCTYFEGSSLATGECTGKICKCSTDICQIRLDFSTFVITGPSTSTISTNFMSGGSIIPALGTITAFSVNQQGGCLTDVFTITNQNTVPILCSTLSGDHVYFDADDSCHELTFNIGQNGIGATAATTRSFSIKVTQLPCGFTNLAPQGCTQWFTGNSGASCFETFNYDNGYHLADQEQIMCVRREEGNCKICWYAASITDIDLGGKVSKGVINQASCCAYGASTAGNNKGTVGGYDCLMIPGATTGSAAKPSAICGGKGGLVVASGTASKTICSASVPFRVEFHSDSWELADDTEFEGGISTLATKGAKVCYFQTSC